MNMWGTLGGGDWEHSLTSVTQTCPWSSTLSDGYLQDSLHFQPFSWSQDESQQQQETFRYMV